jgi:hypothetical protein
MPCSRYGQDKARWGITLCHTSVSVWFREMEWQVEVVQFNSSLRCCILNWAVAVNVLWLACWVTVWFTYWLGLACSCEVIASSLAVAKSRQSSVLAQSHGPEVA